MIGISIIAALVLVVVWGIWGQDLFNDWRHRRKWKETPLKKLTDYDLYDPDAAYRRIAHKKLDYSHIYNMEVDIYGWAYHTKDGEFMWEPALYKPLSRDPHEYDMSKYSIDYYRDPKMHYCTNVGDKTTSCEECNEVNERWKRYQDSFNTNDRFEKEWRAY